VFGVVALCLLGVAAWVLLKFKDEAGSSYHWSTKKCWLFWTSVIIAVGFGIAAVAAPATSYNEARKTERGLGDGPRFPADMIDGRPVDGITEMADNYPNVANKCVWDGFRAFVTSNGDFLAVVVDPACRYVPTGPDFDGNR
jgi:hypothetical protein